MIQRIGDTHCNIFQIMHKDHVPAPDIQYLILEKSLKVSKKVFPTENTSKENSRMVAKRFITEFNSEITKFVGMSPYSGGFTFLGVQQYLDDQLERLNSSYSR